MKAPTHASNVSLGTDVRAMGNAGQEETERPFLPLRTDHHLDDYLVDVSNNEGPMFVPPRGSNLLD